MSKAVMISIKPEWCELIAKGEKTLEIRKTAPKLGTPFKCYIYCTLKGSNEFFKENLNGDIAKWNKGNWGNKKGKVIGEFICDGFHWFGVPYPAFQNEMDKEILKRSCCEYYPLHRYAHHDALVGWSISNLVIYDKPKELSEFNKPFPFSDFCLGCEINQRSHKGYNKEYCGSCDQFKPKIKRPPQSWLYVEELNE